MFDFCIVGNWGPGPATYAELVEDVTVVHCEPVKDVAVVHDEVVKGVAAVHDGLSTWLGCGWFDKDVFGGNNEKKSNISSGWI